MTLFLVYSYRIVNSAQTGDNSPNYSSNRESCKSAHNLKDKFMIPSNVELEKIMATVKNDNSFQSFNKFIQEKGFRAYNKGLFCGYPKKNPGISTNRNFVLSIPYISNSNDSNSMMLIVFSNIDGLSKSFIVSLENPSNPHLVIYKGDKDGKINIVFESSTKSNYSSGDASINSTDWRCYVDCLLESLYYCLPYLGYTPFYAACVAGLTAYCSALCAILP